MLSTALADSCHLVALAPHSFIKYVTQMLMHSTAACSDKGVVSHIKYADFTSSEVVAFTLPVIRHAAKQHCESMPTCLKSSHLLMQT